MKKYTKKILAVLVSITIVFTIANLIYSYDPERRQHEKEMTSFCDQHSLFEINKDNLKGEKAIQLALLVKTSFNQTNNSFQEYNYLYSECCLIYNLDCRIINTTIESIANQTPFETILIEVDYKDWRMIDLSLSDKDLIYLFENLTYNLETGERKWIKK